MSEILREYIRSVVNEQKLSPNFFGAHNKTNKPMDSNNVRKGISSLERSMRMGLTNHLISQYTENHYNTETRELDDKIFDFVKSTVNNIIEKFMSSTDMSMEQVWQEAEQIVKSKLSGGGNDDRGGSSGKNPSTINFTSLR